MEENRKYVRFKAPFCVQYSNEVLKEEVPGVIKDISMGGIRVLLYTDYNVPADSVAFFSILLPENTLKVSARVVWSQLEGERQEIGGYFLKIHDSHRQDLFDSIFRHFKEEITKKWWQT